MQGDRERHLAQGGEVRDEPADGRGGALARILRHLANQLEQQREARQVPLRPAALEGELGRHLLPARAFLADPHVLGHEGVLEDDLVEVMRAREIDDRAHRDARQRRVDQELREPLVLLRRVVARAEQRDHVVGEVRVARPHLGAVDAIAAGHSLGARAQRGEVGARVGLAHADRRTTARRARSPAGTSAAAPRCRSAGAAGRSGDRRSSGRTPARRPRASPRARRSARARCARGRRSAWATSSRSSRARPSSC